MKVLLVNPSWGSRVAGRRYNRAWPPLDLLYTAARLRKLGFEVDLCDARASGITPEAASPMFTDADLVVAGTSPLDRWQCPNLDLRPLLRWTRMIPPEKLLICGVHGTLYPDSILAMTSAKAVVRGEPEETVPALCSALAGSRPSLAEVASVSYRNGDTVFHNPPSLPVDLSMLPQPAYDLTVPGDYEYELLGRNMAVLETARGCPHACAFCLKAMYGKGIRRKPIGRVLEEVRQVRSQGYSKVYFIDLEFCLDRKRTVELCAGLRDAGISWCCQTRVDDVDPGLLREMAASGCRLIHYGIESGAPAIRERIRKNITSTQTENAIHWTRSAGIATAGFFLTGFRGESPGDWLETEKLARKLNPTYASFHRVTPYPRTGRGASRTKPWWENAGELSARDNRIKRAYLRYYLRPSYVAEFLRNGNVSFAPIRLFLSFLKGTLSDVSREATPGQQWRRLPVRLIQAVDRITSTVLRWRRHGMRGASLPTMPSMPTITSAPPVKRSELCSGSDLIPAGSNGLKPGAPPR
ncbi:MAG: radical SAM protein [Syntrophobacter sp.]